MNSNKYIIIALTLGLLLAFSTYASADGDHNTGDTDNHMNYDRDGFTGFSNYMNIVGNLTIEDSILVSLAVFPSNEMNEMMNEEMEEDEIQEMYQYMNRMDVKIIKLVEFYDLDSDGLTQDDDMISEYELSNATLNQPQVIVNGDALRYEVSSIDTSVFKITLDVLSQEGIPFSLKWSYEINYPFIQTNTSMAVIHEINAMNSLEYMDHMMDGLNSDMGTEMNGDMGTEMNDGAQEDHMSGDMDSYMDGELGNMEINMDENRMMSDEHNEMPMEFSWNKTAIVDGFEVNIFSTEVNDSLALSFPQGKTIIYDPKLSIDITSMLSADDRVEEIMETNYTTLLVIIAGIVIVSALVIFLRKH